MFPVYCGALLEMGSFSASLGMYENLLVGEMGFRLAQPSDASSGLMELSLGMMGRITSARRDILDIFHQNGILR